MTITTPLASHALSSSTDRKPNSLASSPLVKSTTRVSSLGTPPRLRAPTRSCATILKSGVALVLTIARQQRVGGRKGKRRTPIQGTVSFSRVENLGREVRQSLTRMSVAEMSRSRRAGRARRGRTIFGCNSAGLMAHLGPTATVCRVRAERKPSWSLYAP